MLACWLYVLVRMKGWHTGLLLSSKLWIVCIRVSDGGLVRWTMVQTVSYGNCIPVHWVLALNLWQMRWHLCMTVTVLVWTGSQITKTQWMFRFQIPIWQSQFLYRQARLKLLGQYLMKDVASGTVKWVPTCMFINDFTKGNGNYVGLVALSRTYAGTYSLAYVSWYLVYTGSTEFRQYEQNICMIWLIW